MIANASIVIVDDEPDLRSMLADHLGREGFRVSGCANGAELDREMERAAPDLVVLDVNLPDEDGISIARRLQAQHRVPIVMLTALGDPIDRVVGLEVGADDYVTKPFDLRELSARIRAILRRANDAGARPAEAKPTAARPKRAKCRLFRRGVSRLRCAPPCRP